MNQQLRAGADWSPSFSAGVWAHLHKESPGRNIYYRPLQMAMYRLPSYSDKVRPLVSYPKG